MTDGGAVDEQVFAYSNGGGPTRSLVLFHDRFGTTTGTIRDSVPVAEDPRRRPQAARAALARGRAGPAERRRRLRGVPRRADRARVDPLVPRDPGARSADDAPRLRGPRLLGVPRGPRRVRGPVGAAGGDARRPGGPLARRRADRAPARAGPRPAASDLRRRSRARRPGRPDRTGATSMASRPGSRTFLTAVASATRRDRRPGGRGGLGPDQDGARLRRRGADRAGRPGHAARLARAVTDRGAGTGRGRRGDQPGLVRRAAADRAAGRGLPDGRPRRGRGVVGRRPRPRAASACHDRRRSADRSEPPTRACSTPGSPTTPSAPRSASTPGRASSGWTATASPRCSAGRHGWMPSKPTRRRTPAWPSACWRPPRRPAIAWMPCGRLLVARRRRPRPWRRSHGASRRGDAETLDDGIERWSSRICLMAGAHRIDVVVRPGRDPSHLSQPSRIRRSSDVGGDPWAITDSRWSR